MPESSDEAVLRLFEAVSELPSDAQIAYLDQHCDDLEVRQRIEAMLAVDSETGGLLDRPAEAQFAELVEPDLSEESLPDRIGPYAVVRRLGSGGMAVVYLAEREHGDFQQTVALKVILPSRLGPHWRERFLQERQILASMSHPHIAQLLDGGVGADGGPYFAMEYIDGLPISQHCDCAKLSIRQRLELLIPVCDAVSYAHRNLIVHRDLKPSNILVDEYGQAKLLDFGIAKLLSDPDASLTVTGQRAMTPDYAAPEQFSGEPVTTATDVYALGVLLYELLAGRRPYDRRGKSPLEIERQILEQSPTTFAELSSSTEVEHRDRIAAARGISWQRLHRTLVGDLENVVLKAIRREPERRYPSVAALADDLRRYLNGLPVRARADSTWYRLSKFAGRHRLGVALSTAAVLALLASTGFALQQASQARQAASAAVIEAHRATETRDFLASLFESASPDRSLGEKLTVRQLLDQGARRVNQELAGQPEVRAEMTLLIGETYAQLGLYEPALAQVKQALALSPPAGIKSVEARLSLSRLHRLMGNFDAAAAQLEAIDESPPGASMDLRSRLLIEHGELAREQARFDDAQLAFNQALALDETRGEAADIARDLYRLASLEVGIGNNDQAMTLMESAMAQLRDHGAGLSTQYAAIQHDLGVLLIQKGELDRARNILTQARELREQMLGDSHPDVAATIKELAVIARIQGDADLAESLYLAALSINESMLGNDHPETANNLNSLAVFYRGAGQNERALEYARRALSGASVVYGNAHPTVGVMTTNVGNLQRMVGELEEARVMIERGLAIILSSVGPEHQLAGVAENALAGVLFDLGYTALAEARFRHALEVFGKAAGSNHPHMLQIYTGLARALVAEDKLDDAAAQYEAAIRVGDAALPPGHINVRMAHLGLAGVRAAQGACQSARQRFDEHIGQVEGSSDSAHQAVLDQARRAMRECAS